MHHSFFSITIIMYIFTCIYTGHHIRQIILPNTSKHNTLIKKLAFFAIYFLLSSSIFLGFTTRFGVTVQNIGCVLWGFYFYFLIFCFISDLFLGVLLVISTCKHKQIVTENVTKKTYLVSIVSCIIFLICGALYAKVVRTPNYDVIIESNSTSTPTSVKIIMLSDTHLGKQLGLKDVEKWVEKINELEPDMVCISGDIFNDSLYNVDNLEQIENTLSTINSKYGTYACLGNHDTEGIIDSYGNLTTDVMEFFHKSNITLLYDEYKLVDNLFYIVGRSDASPSMDETNYSSMELSQILEGTDSNIPVILLDHRPQRFDEAKDNQVDLLLAGHTHLGQLYPANIITNITYECDYGIYTDYLEGSKHNFTAIVSSGLGYWGPPLRIGSSCELVVINVTIE